ncbi:MAG: alpha/beta hydrolase [Anaerolineales bacterium]
MNAEEVYLDIGIKIHLRQWLPKHHPDSHLRSYLLLHGLSSNARTWDQVAERLCTAGHQVAAIDQRGHGLSEKPDSGYDFATVTRDLQQVIQQLAWDDPVLVGQSWGGNVLLEHAARYPGTAREYIFVDGGFLNLGDRGSWEQIKVELRPPDLAGMPLKLITEHIRSAHPDWSEEGIQGTLGNFEVLPDQTVKPWLTLEHHLEILKAMYDQDPPALYPKIKEPILICAADDGGARMPVKREQVKAAADGLKKAEVIWFPNAAHDIHVDQPEQLTKAILAFQT